MFCNFSTEKKIMRSQLLMNHLEFPLFRTGDSLVLYTFEIVLLALTLRYALHNHENASWLTTNLDYISTFSLYEWWCRSLKQDQKIIQLTTFMFASGKLGRYFNWSSEASVSVMKNNEKNTTRNCANMLTVILPLENRRAYQNTLIYFFLYGCMTARDVRLRSVVVACRNVSTFGTPRWCSWTKNRRIPMIHYMSAKKSFLQLSY